MKIIFVFAWKRKDKMRELTNADPYDHLLLSLVGVNDAIKRIAEREGITSQEVAARIVSRIEREEWNE